MSVRRVDSLLFHSDTSQDNCLLTSLMSVAGLAHIVRFMLVTATTDPCWVSHALRWSTSNFKEFTQWKTLPMLSGNVPCRYNLQGLNNRIFFYFEVKCKGICPMAFQKMPSRYKFSALSYLLLSWSWKNEVTWRQQFLCINVSTFFPTVSIQRKRIAKVALIREIWILFSLWKTWQSSKI